MAYANEIMIDGGVGLINVPSGQQIFSDGLWQLVHLQHINYFSGYSLSLLAQRAGFEILGLESDEAAVELNLWIRKPHQSCLMKDVISVQRKIFRDILSSGRDVVIWGAGSKAVYNMKLLDGIANIKYCVDNDERKTGMYMAGIPVPIAKPKKDILEAVDFIVIIASTYNSEILQELSNVYHYHGQVIYFDGDEIMVRDMRVS